MQRKDGLPKRHGGGRKRTVFCDRCKIVPIPVKECRPCQTIAEAARRDRIRERHLEQRRTYYAANRERLRAKDNAWKRERWQEILDKERLRKSHTRYGEFAEAHIEFRKLIRQLKEMKNETGKETNEVGGNQPQEQYHNRYDF